MERFLENFLEKNVLSLSGKCGENLGCYTESNAVKIIQKIIFKHDMLTDFKLMLSSVCSGSEFSVKNETVKKLMLNLSEVMSWKVDEKTKIFIFQYMLQSLAGTCKEDESVLILQFLVVLSYLVGIKLPFSECSESCVNIREETFQNVFKVSIPKPSSLSFLVLDRLLKTLSNLPVNLNSPEAQPYYKWLQTLIKNLVESKPFFNIFLEIFLTCGNINIKLLEGNLDVILSNVLTLNIKDKKFCESLNCFLITSLKINSKFQRTSKFVSKFLVNLKASSKLLPQEVVISSDFYHEFSKIVAVMPSQQLLLLMEDFVHHIHDCFKEIRKNHKGNVELFSLSSQFFIHFLKEVKIFAPSISITTVQSFSDNMLFLCNELNLFAEYLMSDKDQILKEEKVTRSFLNLCYYFSEIQILINCYKDYFTSSANSSVTSSNSCDWNYCLTSEQWEAIAGIILESNLVSCNTICFQLALLRLRSLKLESSISSVEKCTLKLLVASFKLENDTFEVLPFMRPEDVVTLMEVLTIQQTKSVIQKLFKEIMDKDIVLRLAWLTSPALHENLTFVTNFFSEILKETGNFLLELGVSEKVNWLLGDYINEENSIIIESVKNLPEKINRFLEKGNKIQKLAKNSCKSLSRIIRMFLHLPLMYMESALRKLSLSLVVTLLRICPENEDTIKELLQSVSKFVTSGVDASACFDVGLLIKWLCEMGFDSESVDRLRVKVLGDLIRSCTLSEEGLKQLDKVVGEKKTFSKMTSLKFLEAQIIIHQELSKCCARGRKRKSDDTIGEHRNKVAKVLTEAILQYKQGKINSENDRVLLKIAIIELTRAVKMNDNSALAKFIQQKFEDYLDHAVHNLKRDYDETSVAFLSAVLSSMSKVRPLIHKNSLQEIWSALKHYEKGNWFLFLANTTDEEFKLILTDLLQITKKFLDSQSASHSVNYFSIWTCFIDRTSNLRKTECQLRLQELFDFLQNCELTLSDLPPKKLLQINEFFLFCTSNSKVIVTSQMLDTILRVMTRSVFDSESTVEDFRNLFTVQIEIGCSLLSRESTWNKNKVHLIYELFKHLLGVLMERFGRSSNNEDDVVVLSSCGFSMEKWVSLMASKHEDFARISAYFISTLIASMVAVTISSAIKIHLVNCLNHFLSKSDAHTIAYLLRILKPGHQQVFNTVYDEFKKYHKYCGKV